MATRTPIIVVEDNALIALGVRSIFAKAQDRLGMYGQGPIQTVASGRMLFQWLESQPASTVVLMLIDHGISGGESTTFIPRLRDPQAHTQHGALHPDALLIGWSANVGTQDLFRAVGTNGFISKQRPLHELAEDVITLIERHQAGETWVELL